MAPPAPRAPLTKLAEKYSHPIGTIAGINHRVLKNTGKSGLTPLSPFHVRGPLAGRILQKYKIYCYQQHRYAGFTAAELHGLDAMSALNTEPMRSRLTNPVHPMFGKSKWDTDATLPRHLGFIPILGGHEGFWNVSNPIVWEILEPALQLASMLLTNANVYPWWDALFTDRFDEVEQWRIRPEEQHMRLLSFHQRRPEERNTPQAIRNVQDAIIQAASNIRMALTSGYTNTETLVPKRRQYTYASMKEDFFQGFTKINLSIELLEPLLRNDLTDAKRMSLQFRVASTVIHESTHAIWNRIERNHPYTNHVEPYFEAEPLAELGWSLETKLWGGEAYDMVPTRYSRGGKGLPPMGIFRTEWFAYNHEGYVPHHPVLEHGEYNLERWEEDKYYINDFWPVPVSWSHGLFQPELWSGPVRALGAKATQMGPLTWGTRLHADDRDESINYLKIIAQAFPPTSFIPETVDTSMTDEERARIGFENARKRQAEKIYNAMTLALAAQPDDLNPDFFRDGIIDRKDLYSDSEDEEEDEPPVPPCPRWNEITQFLFHNRGPNELALDTMTFDMPEPTFYRYIMDRGGLAITPAEFRDFLAVANHQQLLFQWFPFPGVGTIRRRAEGWPPAQKYTIPRNAPPTARDMWNFKSKMSLYAVIRDYYTKFGEFRDLDYDTLCKFVNHYIDDESEHIPLFEMTYIVNECARDGSRLVTLGPKGVARMVFEIPWKLRERSEPPPFLPPRTKRKFGMKFVV